MKKFKKKKIKKLNDELEFKLSNFYAFLRKYGDQVYYRMLYDKILPLQTKDQIDTFFFKLEDYIAPYIEEYSYTFWLARNKNFSLNKRGIANVAMFNKKCINNFKSKNISFDDKINYYLEQYNVPSLEAMYNLLSLERDFTEEQKGVIVTEDIWDALEVNTIDSLKDSPVNFRKKKVQVYESNESINFGERRSKSYYRPEVKIKIKQKLLDKELLEFKNWLYDTSDMKKCQDLSNLQIWDKLVSQNLISNISLLERFIIELKRSPNKLPLSLKEEDINNWWYFIIDYLQQVHTFDIDNTLIWETNQFDYNFSDLSYFWLSFSILNK